VHRDMLARMVAVSGYRGPGALKPLRRCTARANPNSCQLTSRFLSRPPLSGGIFPSSSSSGGGRVHGGPPRRPPGACMCGHRCATTTTTHLTPLAHHHQRRRRRRRQHVKDAAQDVAEEDIAQDLAFGAQAVRALLAMPPPPPPPSLCSSHKDGNATGQLRGIWLGLWASASGGAAQSASMLI